MILEIMAVVELFVLIANTAKPWKKSPHFVLMSISFSTKSWSWSMTRIPSNRLALIAGVLGSFSSIADFSEIVITLEMHGMNVSYRCSKMLSGEETMSSPSKRTFSLPAVQARYIDRKVKSGAYASASEVVRAGLRMPSRSGSKIG